jgi:hypothetical protein
MTKNDNNNDTKKKLKEKNIISSNNYRCVGPCYPPGVNYYNPFNLIPIISDFPSCPVDPKGKKGIIFDKCNVNDIDENYQNFDIFKDIINIASTPNLFLKQIYHIYNISDIVYFLNDTVDILPIYTQRRVLKAIFETYYKYVEFPKLLFISKLKNVLEKIYNIKNLNPQKTLSILDNISQNSYSLYKYLISNLQ